jgi:hypothetical protein
VQLALRNRISTAVEPTGAVALPGRFNAPAHARRRLSRREIRHGLSLLVVALLWPFGALLAAFRYYRRPSSQVAVVAFSTFYGLTMVVVGDYVDSARYRAQFLSFRDATLGDLWRILTTLYTEQAEATDPILAILYFAVSRVTGDPRWLFAAFGLFFGYFYAKNIWLLIELAGTKIRLSALPFLVAFALIVPIFLINGFRMWTAAHIFFYAAMNVAVYRRPWYFAYAVLAALVHFSFLLPLVILAAFHALGRRDSIYIPLAIASAFARDLRLDRLLGYADLLGPAIEMRARGYTSVAMFERVAGEAQYNAWFVLWKGDILVYALTLALALGMFRYLHANSDRLGRLFSFCVLFLAVANFVSFVPSMGRFLTVWALLGTAYVFLVCQQSRKSLIPMHAVALLPLVMYVVIEIRIGMEWTSALLLFSNPIVAIVAPTETTMLQALFGR